MKYAAILLLSGCSLTTEVGVLSDGLTAGRYGHESIGAVVTSTRLELPPLTMGPVSLIAGAQPTFYQPFDGKSPAVGGDLTLELTACDSLFVIFTAGLFQSDTPWGRQATDWGFANQIGIGFRYHGLSVSYRQFHESNGATFWGNGRRPNPGYESGGIFVGYQVEF